MKLTQLLERLDYTCLQGTMDREIGRVVADSRAGAGGCPVPLHQKELCRMATTSRRRWRPREQK